MFLPVPSGLLAHHSMGTFFAVSVLSTEALVPLRPRLRLGGLDVELEDFFLALLIVKPSSLSESESSSPAAVSDRSPYG